MIYQVFTVKDLKADAFAPPFFLHRAEVAVRTFADALHDVTHPMHAHPEDYVLYTIGSFDDELGKLIPLDQPRMLVNGLGEAS